MKGSLIVVGFFALGLLAGRSGCMPTWLMEGDISMVALCALLLFVGIGIGLNPDMKNELKSLSPRLALLPLVTILGSWIGAAVAYLFLGGGICTFLQHRELTDCLAINSGFAYYSLSSIFVTEYRGAELGTIALLANIIREMATLLLTPLLARWFGPLAPISSGGATSMDTAQHYTVHRTTICALVYLPRFRDRFHRPLPRHPLVRISVASLRRMVTYLLTMRLRLNLRQTPTSTHSYGEGVGGGELMGLRTMVKKGNFSARLSAQNLEKNTSKTTFLNIR